MNFSHFRNSLFFENTFLEMEKIPEIWQKHSNLKHKIIIFIFSFVFLYKDSVGTFIPSLPPFNFYKFLLIKMFLLLALIKDKTFREKLLITSLSDIIQTDYARVFRFFCGNMGARVCFIGAEYFVLVPSWFTGDQHVSLEYNMLHWWPTCFIGVQHASLDTYMFHWSTTCFIGV